jgi:hypothetical protein
MIFFTTTIFGGSGFFVTETNRGFVINRLFLFAALTVICLLLDAAVRQISETEAARKEIIRAELRAESVERDLELQRKLADMNLRLEL